MYPTLGTELRVSLAGSFRPKEFQDLERGVAVEIERLENVLSAFRPNSDLARWRTTGELTAPELARVLAAALHWQQRSAGAFTVNAGVASAIWSAFEKANQEPPDSILEDLISALTVSPFTIETDPKTSTPKVTRTADCSLVNLNAIAKGFVVDAAAQWLLAHGAERAMVNIGGDIAHCGSEPRERVGIEDPAQPFDNAPPLATIALCNGAIATSGSSRRGWQIANRWYSHVIDPRTARPVDHIASASVLAPSAMDADAIATVLSVIGEPERGTFAQQLPSDVGFCVVDANYRVHTNSVWDTAILR